MEQSTLHLFFQNVSYSTCTLSIVGFTLQSEGLRMQCEKDSGKKLRDHVRLLYPIALGLQDLEHFRHPFCPARVHVPPRVILRDLFSVRYSRLHLILRAHILLVHVDHPQHLEWCQLLHGVFQPQV